MREKQQDYAEVFENKQIIFDDLSDILFRDKILNRQT